MGVLTVEDTLRRENRDLRDENYTLKEQIIQLRKLLVPDEWQVPTEFRLTAQECKILSLLYTSTGFVKRPRLFDLLYSLDHTCDIPDLKVIEVYICKIRKKLKPYGIFITTVNNRGYFLEPASRQILENWNKQPEMVD